MKISEFDKEKDKIDTLAVQKDSLIHEMERVQEVLENVDDIVSDVDRQFKEKTGIINETDLSFLFVAVMLQSLRWILSPELEVSQVLSMNEEKIDEKNLHIAKADRMKSDEQEHCGGIYDKKKSGKYYEKKETEKYFDEHKEKTESAKKEYHDDSGRDTKYRTWIEIMLRPVPYDAMNAIDKNRIPKIAGVNKYNEKEGRNGNITGKNHHVATLGHDPVLGWIFGTMNIMSSSITMCDFHTYDVVQNNPKLSTRGQKINYAKEYMFGELIDYCVNSEIEDNKRLPAAVVRQGMHFASDKYCKEGLPIPLLSVIDPEKAQELIEKGWNSREFSHLAKGDLGVIGANVVISIFINEILKAIYLYLLELDEKDTQIKEVRIRKVLTVANLIVSTSNVVFTSVTRHYEKLDIGGIGVSLIQLFTTKRFIDEVKQEFIASGIEQAIMGDDDWLRYALRENPNMSKKEELINQGRHQVSDPMVKKMGQLKEVTETVLSNAISSADRQNTMLKQVVTEGKDKSLGIKRLVSFADLTEDHDIDIVHKILDRYCTCGITEMNQATKELRIGLNESKKFVDYHNSADNSYEFLFSELEDKEIASRLLLEIVSLYNCYAEEYNEEEYARLVDEMVISKKERKNIEEYIKVYCLDYSINKWIKILLAGYMSDTKRGADEQQDILEEQDELQTDMDGNNMDSQFDEWALANLQSIMDKYGIHKSEAGYKYLTESFFAITPDAYLGTNFGTHFTVTALYYEGVDDTKQNKWVCMDYKEICIERITYRQEGKKEHVLVIPDVNGNCIRYRSSSKEICEYITALLRELKNAKTAEYDEYNPIWLEETYLYGEILVDFLKMGGHNTLAALKKCSEFIEDGEDEEDVSFRQICEYGLAVHRITDEVLKQKVLEWKSSLEPHMVRIYMAILFKDLVEILQLATGEACEMTIVEKSFLDWLADEAGIKELDKFKEVVMLPYGMISENENMYSSYSQSIADIEKYAYGKQLYIPYNILDNEKIGLWTALHMASKKYWSFLIPTKKNQEELDALVIEVRWFLLCDFLISLTWFVDRITSFEDELISKQQVKEFIKNCGVWSELAEDIYEWLEDEDWTGICVEYSGKDRRYVGKVAIEYLQPEEIDNGKS